MVSLLFLSWFLTLRFSEPWTNTVDFNGAVWTQAAHNLLQAGLGTTAGVPAVFYFGPPPIPASEYYAHHPSLLHLEIALLIQLFGEHEWVARLLPVVCSLMSAILLWLLVKECAGPRAATLATTLFASLPMELHYGSMVNFEPCTLMWMLLGMLGLRRWEMTGKSYWCVLMVSSLALAMFTAWLGYFLVLILCIHFTFFARNKQRALSFLLLGIALFSVAVFLFQIRWIKPEAWEDLAGAFRLRLGQKLSNGEGFTLHQWADRVGHSLLVHFPPLAWVLAGLGALRGWRSRQALPQDLLSAGNGVNWLNWVSFCFFLLSFVYVVGFKNASFIHDYASFYFLVPLSIMGGVGLDGLAERISKARGISGGAFAGNAVVLSILLLSGWTGYQGAKALETQTYILETDDPEPADLVPALGNLLKKEFAPETYIYCNFAVDYCPQLGYYSQRLLINGLTEADDWKDGLASEKKLPGGVIWMGAPEAKEILAILPAGPRREVNIGGIPFCIWNGRGRQ